MGLTEELYQDPTEHTGSGQSSGFNAGAIWDILSVFSLVGILVAVLITLIIFLNPYIGLNPFPPPAIVPSLVIPTHTPTPKSMPAVWTDTPEPTFTATFTALPPTFTAEPLPTQASPAAEATVDSAYRYQLRGEPAVLAGTVIHPDEVCKLWVAGQAFDMKSAPVVGLTVQIGGSLRGRQVYLLSLTGTALQYGPGGYEFVLAEEAVASNGSLWVQLQDQEGYPLSAKETFDTYADCEQNLILVNFKQVR